MGMLGAFSDDGGSHEQRRWLDGGVDGKAEETGQSRSIKEGRRRSRRPRRRAAGLLGLPVCLGCRGWLRGGGELPWRPGGGWALEMLPTLGVYRLLRQGWRWTGRSTGAWCVAGWRRSRQGGLHGWWVQVLERWSRFKLLTVGEKTTARLRR